MGFVVRRRWMGLRSALVILVGGMMAWGAGEGKASAMTDPEPLRKSQNPEHPALSAKHMVIQKLGISQG